jgi:phosphatidylglycerophosphate synthase
MEKKDSFLKSFAEIKKFAFNHQLNKFPFLNDFYKNPYTYIKGRYYMYCSVVLLFVLVRTNIRPNMVTLAYVFLGLIGGLLLAIPNYYCNMAAVIIFFNKGILDWSDGHLARIKFKTTLTGHILDEYGAVINSICLTVGLGFYAMHQSNLLFLMYLIPIAPLLHGTMFVSFGKIIMFNNLNDLLMDKSTKKDHKKKNNSNKNDYSVSYPSILSRLSNILDDRARSVDFILLIVLCDSYFSTYNSIYIFLLILLKLFIMFFLSLYYGLKYKRAEASINNINT